VKRLKRLLLLATAGFVAKQIRSRLKHKERGAPDADPTAAPFETKVEGDSVQYEAANPVDRDPKDPDEPFGGQPMR
jgi:hypothetical protein